VRDPCPWHRRGAAGAPPTVRFLGLDGEIARVQDRGTGGMALLQRRASLDGATSFRPRPCCQLRRQAGGRRRQWRLSSLCAGWGRSRLASHRRGRLRARPSPGGGPGAVAPPHRCCPSPAERHPGWFAADQPVGRSHAPRIRRHLVPDQACRPRGGKTHYPIDGERTR